MFWRFLEDPLARAWGLYGAFILSVAVLVSFSSCAHVKSVPQDRARIFGAAVLVSHATGAAILQCLDQANMLKPYEEVYKARKRCDTDATGVWTTTSKAFENQEDGIMAPCEVRDAARFLADMGQGHLAVVQDALAEAEWASLRCR